ncbi:hypothetical protein [Lonepinella sp. BR2474]|uniref:hypothetical protein n=1 Tax=Lonepinella sp. BR2474 TaxID=3434548 RepID=UPI003F6E198A
MKTILVIDDLDFIEIPKIGQDVKKATLFTGKTLRETALDFGAVIVNGKLIQNRYGDLDMPIEELYQPTKGKPPMKQLKTYLQNILTGFAVAFLFIASIAIISSCQPAHATESDYATPQERCADKGGIWRNEYCHPRDMTDAEIEEAQRWVTLKQLEIREVK